MDFDPDVHDDRPHHNGHIIVRIIEDNIVLRFPSIPHPSSALVL